MTVRDTRLAPPRGCSSTAGALPRCPPALPRRCIHPIKTPNLNLARQQNRFPNPSPRTKPTSSRAPQTAMIGQRQLLTACCVAGLLPIHTPRLPAHPVDAATPGGYAQRVKWLGPFHATDITDNTPGGPALPIQGSILWPLALQMRATQPRPAQSGSPVTPCNRYPFQPAGAKLLLPVLSDSLELSRQTFELHLKWPSGRVQWEREGKRDRVHAGVCS
jgi:hypothetical protein